MIRVINPENSKVIETIDMIRDLDLERFIIGYSKKTRHLFYVENRDTSMKRITSVKARLYPYDP